MSKFDHGTFDDLFVLSKEKYDENEAIDIARIEFEHRLRSDEVLYYKEGYVRHRAGINEDNEPCVGWWLEFIKKKRSCPCWVFCTSKVVKNGYKLARKVEG